MALLDKSSIDDMGGKRHRSPQFPYYSLRECVKLINLFYKKDRFNQVTMLTAMKDMNLSSTSSSSKRAFSSIISYGLLKSKTIKGNKIVWLSDLSKKIIIDKSEYSPKKIEALREAALNDPAFSRVFSKWKNELPLRDVILETLIEENFNENAALRFATVIRDNYDYANLTEVVSPIIEEEIHDETSPSDTTDTYSDKSEFSTSGDLERKKISPLDKSYFEIDLPKFTIPLIGGGVVIISGPFPVDKRNYEHIKKWLNLMEQALVSDEFGVVDNVSQEAD